MFLPKITQAHGISVSTWSTHPVLGP